MLEIEDLKEICSKRFHKNDPGISRLISPNTVGIDILSIYNRRPTAEFEWKMDLLSIRSISPTIPELKKIDISFFFLSALPWDCSLCWDRLNGSVDT